MKVKRIISTVLSFAMIGTVMLQSTIAHAEENKVESYELYSCYNPSNVATLTVNGQDVPVRNYTDLYDYAQFSFDGTANIEVTVKENIETFSVSPLAKNIVATANGKKLSFSISESIYMIVKINGIKEIVIAADTLETDVPDSSGEGIYNIAEAYGADATGVNLSTTSIQSAIDDANAAGGGIVYVPKGLYYIDTSIVLRSNVHMYLAGGAVIRSVADPTNYQKFYRKSSLKMDGTWLFYTEENGENIKIYGRGVLDGNGYNMRQNHKFLATIVMPIGCSYFTLDGITLLDGNFWSLIPTRCDNVTITNTKHFNENNVLHENDAIDIVESQNVILKHVIAMSEDDTYSTKTWSTSTDIAQNWYGSPEELKDVTFDDCFGWTHCGTFKLGDGCNQPQSNVTFKNSYSYKCMQAIKVSHGYGTKDFKDVLFDNIDIEGYGGRSATDRRWLLIDTFSGTAEDNGNIDGLTIKNINIRDLGTTKSTMKGRENQAYVYGVTFENIKVPGQAEYASSLEEMNITDTNIQGTSDYKILPIDNTVKYDTTGNLAYNENVAATCSSIESETFTADKAIDGDAGTRWTSGATDSEWMMLDFGETISFNRVRILWEAAYGTDYKIQYSDDANTWKDAIVVTGGDGNTDILDFERVSGRYVRFLGIKRVQDKNGFSFYEFEVYNFDDYDYQSLPELTVQLRLAKRDYTDTVLKQYTNDSAAEFKAAMASAEAIVNSENPTGITEALRRLTIAKANLQKRATPTAEYNMALNKPVFVSGEQNETSQAYKAVDGSATSCWRSQMSGAPFWITVDLGENDGYDMVVFNWEDSYATNYKLCVSDDNENWTDITVNGETHLSAPKKTVQTLYLDEIQTARYLRMYCLEKASMYGVGIFEFEVYNTADIEEKPPVENPDPEIPEDGNVAINATATASSNDAKYTPEMGSDGDDTTRWGRNNSQNNAGPHWYKLDLGAVYSIDKISVIWENLPASYNVEVSEDNVNWNTVISNAAPNYEDYTLSNGDAKWKTEESFDVTKARYVRINMTAQVNENGKYYISFYEITVNAVKERQTVMMGDVNGDGKINSTDFMQVRRHYLGLYTIPEESISSADVNRDGKINSTDFMQIRRHFLGLFTIA